MNRQGYGAEEREKQIAVVTEQEKKHGKKWRELRPRSLLRGMADLDAVTAQQLKTILKTEYHDRW
jgi:hypothetical protein